MACRIQNHGHNLYIFREFARGEETRRKNLSNEVIYDHRKLLALLIEQFEYKGQKMS